MKDKTVYLIHGEIADYSDSDWWPVAVFTSEDKAQVHRQLCLADPAKTDPYTAKFSKYRIEEVDYVVTSIPFDPIQKGNS